MTSPGEGFPRAARIRRRREFLALGRSADRRQTPHLVVLVRRRAGAARLGVTVSGKVAGAVDRNRVKRRLREIFRRDPARLLPEHDIVIIAKQGAAGAPLRTLEHELRDAVSGRARRRRS